MLIKILYGITVWLNKDLINLSTDNDLIFSLVVVNEIII